MSRLRSASASLVSLALLLLAAAPAVVCAAEVGKRVDKFTLPDFHGRDRSLDEFADKQLVVVAFLGTDCPLARLYGPRLQELADEYAAKGVAFIGVDPNQQDSLTDMAGFAQQHGVKFPLLKDRDQSLADKLGAVRYPEVFVLDNGHTIRYRGRIDDQYGLGSSSGYAKSKVKTRDLANALDELLAGKAVSQSSTEVTGCLITRVAKSEPKGEVTYSKHIAAIMQDHCVTCHRPGQIGPFALTDYEEVAGWGAMMKEVVSENRMPPWSANPEHGRFANDARLSESEKKLIFAWVDNGCPEGNKADLPKPRTWTEGWRMEQPDQIVKMEKAFHVPAEGVLPYQHIVLDPKWTEDKWIQAAEVRPGNRAVVHHIIASARGPSGDVQGVDGTEGGNATQGRGGRRRGVGGEGTALTNYVPGGTATVYPPGVALLVKAGSKIVLQMHYTPNGVEGDDQSYIGFKFADPKNIKKRVYGGVAGNNSFVIPPQTDNYKVVSESIIPKDQLMLWMMPHMHVRGKSFRYEAAYPDGTREILLDVPRYDFNWQITYELAEPKRLPAGTKLQCTAYYDNSENNPSNPDPNDTVKWGPQTWHEMMFGWFWTLPVEDDAHLARVAAE